MPGMKLIQVYVPQRDLEALEELVKRKLYPPRAEAIRLAVKDLIDAHEGKKLDAGHTPEGP